MPVQVVARFGPPVDLDCDAQVTRFWSQFAAEQPAFRGVTAVPLVEVQRLLNVWASGPQLRTFDSTEHLAEELVRSASTLRLNHYHGVVGSDRNIAAVQTGVVPGFANGFREIGIFAEKCWDPRLDGRDDDEVRVLMRQAEQEYALHALNKGSLLMLRAAARYHNVCIAVRPTGVLSHLPIESGLPTKPQEFKNKTSKYDDLWLCDELDPTQVGAVVHYNPCAAGDPERHGLAKAAGWSRLWTELRWAAKKRWIESMPQRDPARHAAIQRVLGLARPVAWPALKKLFEDRLQEIAEFDHKYRAGGEYAGKALVVGPFLRLRVRPDVNVFGDHDLFGYGASAAPGVIRLTRDHREAQIQLQLSTNFQAQHGGVWNWRPHASETKNVSIRNIILASHSLHGKPLVCATENGRIVCCFLAPGGSALWSVWNFAGSLAWLTETRAGSILLGRPGFDRNAIQQQLARLVAPPNSPALSPQPSLVGTPVQPRRRLGSAAL